MKKLKPREKRTVFIAGVAVIVVFVIWYFFLWENSLWEKWRDLQSRIASREEMLSRMRHLQNKYAVLQAKIDEVVSQMGTREHQDAQEFVERMKQEHASGAVIVKMQPQSRTVHDLYREDSVMVKLGQIELPELVNLLYHMENSGGAFKVNELRIGLEKKTPDLLEAEFVVVSATPLGPENGPAPEEERARKKSSHRSRKGGKKSP